MHAALAMLRLLGDLGARVLHYGAPLRGWLALALLVGRRASPGALLLGMAGAGIALGLAWSSRARVWRGLRAVGETLYGLALVLGLWVGIPLVVWAGYHVRADARRRGVRGVDGARARKADGETGRESDALA